MSEQIFLQLAIILGIAFLVSYIIRLLKQPLIIGYIIAGIIVSPFLISFGATGEITNVFSKIGIAFLLFIVGLHLNPKIIKNKLMLIRANLVSFGKNNDPNNETKKIIVKKDKLIADIIL